MSGNQPCRRRLSGEPDDEQHARRRQRHEPAMRARPHEPNGLAGAGAEHREHEVEDDLDRQRPRWPDARDRRLRVVVLDEERASHQQPGVEARAVVQPRRIADEDGLQTDRGDEEDHPVDREDAQRAVAQVRADRRRRLVVQRRGGKRAIQQEARQREEERHAVLEIEKHPGHRPQVDRPTGGRRIEPHVADADAARRERAHALDAGQSRALRREDAICGHGLRPRGAACGRAAIGALATARFYGSASGRLPFANFREIAAPAMPRRDRRGRRRR